MSRKIMGIQKAAEFLGVSAQTLRRWERAGRLMPDERTPGGRQRYELARLRPEHFYIPRAAVNLERRALTTASSAGRYACGEEGSGRGRKTAVKPTSMKQDVSFVPV